jgi:hypothetical protein
MESLKGPQAWDIRRQDFYTYKTCMDGLMVGASYFYFYQQLLFGDVGDSA